MGGRHSCFAARRRPHPAPKWAPGTGIYRTTLGEAGVYDGDTFWVELPAAAIVPTATVQVKIRAKGIDAPELRGPGGGAERAAEKAAAERARDAAVELLGGEFTVGELKFDKYGGRLVGSVRLGDGRAFADAMIAAGHAVAYDGGTKVPYKDWR